MRNKTVTLLLVVLALVALAAAGAFFMVEAGGSSGGDSQSAQADAVSQPQAPLAAADAAGSQNNPGAAPDQGATSPTPAVPSGKTDPKIESSLSELAATRAAGGPDAASEFAASHKIDYKDGNVTIVLESNAQGDAGIATAVTASGGAVQASYGNLLQASLPVGRLTDISSLGSVKYIRGPSHPTSFATTDEGVADIGANTWQAAGLDGTGVKIAIVDPGFANYQQAVTAGDLPANVITRSFRADGDITGAGQDHGTACAELVHDVAPGAQIYLVNFDTDVELGNAVDYLISQNVKVVSASWGFFGSFRGDGQGPVDDIVQKAYSGGIFWANAAGNAAQSHWSGHFTDANNNSWTEFSGSDEHNTVTAQAGNAIDVYLTWNSWPGTDQDYDLYLVWSGNPSTPVATSDSWQSGTQKPAEEIHYTVPAGMSGNYWIMIKKYSATGDAVFQLYTYPKSVQYRTAASSLGGQPTDSAYAMTVGAVPVGGNTIESFSSMGPTLDGRIKPDISGPDRVSTFTYGYTGFWGTSAAAPHAAGAGALLQGANSSYTPAQIQASLESKAIDLGVAGKDNTYGSGRLTLGALPDFTPPAITGVQPAGDLYATSAAIVVYYSDAGSGIDTSSVSVTLDGSALAGCNVTTTYASCASGTLGAGPHAIGGSVGDISGNKSKINGSFVVKCAAPQLQMATLQSYWGSYADYLAHELSVSYKITDTGGTGAFSLQIEGTLNTYSIITRTTLPLLLGDIPAGTYGNLPVTLRYLVPPGVTSFKSMTYITVNDACGNSYAFPGVYPGN